MIKKIFLVCIMMLLSCTQVFAANDFNEYLKKVKNDVSNIWISPSYSTKYNADVYFRIQKDGSISDVEIVSNSKSTKLNSSALKAINSIQKFDELPSFYNSEYIEVTLSFTNEVSKSVSKTVYSKKKKRRVNQIKTIAVAPKSLKIKKVVYLEYFECDSNYKDGMKDLVLNLDIQKAKRN